MMEKKDRKQQKDPANRAESPEEKTEKRAEEKAEGKTEAKNEGKTGTAVDTGRARMYLLGINAVFGAVAFLAGQRMLPFQTYPFGVGLLCASGRQTPGILLGLIAAALAGEKPAYICVYLAVAAIRWVFSVLLVHTPEGGTEPSGERVRAVAAHLRRHLRERRQGTVPAAAGSASAGAAEVGTEPEPAVQAEAGDADAAEADGEAPARGVPFGESIGLRVLCGAVGALLMGMINCIAGGFQFYDLFGMALLLSAVPLCCLLYAPYFTATQDGDMPEMTVRYAVGAGSLAMTAVYSAAGFSLFGISPAPLLSMALTLLVCRRRGFLYGTGCGVLVGLACDPLSAPLFVAAALLYALLRPVSEGLALFCATAGAAGFCLYIGGLNNLVRVFPAILAAVPVYLLAVRFLSGSAVAKKEPKEVSVNSDFAAAVTAGNRLNASRGQMMALSESFSSLSEIFYDLSDRFRRPRVLDLRRICDTGCAKYCEDCPSRDVCWGAGYSETLDMINRLATQLHTRGHVDLLLLPDEVRLRCLRLEKIAAHVNRECAALPAAMLKNDNTAIFAADYEAISDILNDSLTEDAAEYECDREAAVRIFDYLSARGTTVHGVVVCGKRARRVIVRGSNFAKSAGKAQELRDAMSELCGMALGDPVFEIGTDCTVMILTARPNLRIRHASARLAASEASETSGAKEPVPVGVAAARERAERADDERICAPMSGESFFASAEDRAGEPGAVCGDTVNCFSNDNAYFYALVSDGMGSGEEASFTSRICSIFLEKMLRACNHTDVTLRMLNSFIRSKNSCTGTECSATVDLMELDLLSGSASFAKSGAAPTYIVRDGAVFILRSRTLPIGIIRSPDVRVTRSEISAGDTVIMVSDGVTQNNDECPWLVSLLSASEEIAPEELSRLIVRKAAQAGSSDDISAVVVRVEAATAG